MPITEAGEEHAHSLLEAVLSGPVAVYAVESAPPHNTIAGPVVGTMRFNTENRAIYVDHPPILINHNTMLHLKIYNEKGLIMSTPALFAREGESVGVRIYNG